MEVNELVSNLLIIFQLDFTDQAIQNDEQFLAIKVAKVHAETQC